MKQIAPHIYVEDGYRGVTVGCIVTDSGVICIDSPMSPADARDWRAKIERLNNKPVRFVILTDAHRDRILGLQYLGGAVVAHEAAWEKMRSYGDTFRQQAVDALSPCNGSSPAEVAADLRIVLPHITFTNTLALHKGDSPVVIQHVGGATPGSIWVCLPQQNVLFMGDLVTPHTHPVASEGDLTTWLDLLEKVHHKDFPAKTIVPGRGSPCRKAALEPMARYLRAMRTRVQSLIRSRRPKADTALLVPEFLSRYPVAPDELECMQRRIKAGLDHIYDALKNKR
jgi:glyoxylase-like metal-dependent hydrolase (beta-lactamase superfamily II)